MYTERSVSTSIWAYNTSLTPPRLIEVHAQSQESERSRIRVLGYRF